MKKYIPLFLLFVSCSVKEKKIKPNEIVKKCVITDCVIENPRSSLEYEPSIKYFTDCGEVIVTRHGRTYQIGDTLTFVYKKWSK